MKRLLLSLLASCTLLSACAPQPLAVTREPVTLRLVTADSCGPLAQALTGAYEEFRPWVTVEIKVFDTSIAEQALRAGEADVALLSWLVESSSEEPLWSQPFGNIGIAVIAHPATPFPETGLAHLQEIFRGRVQEWNGTVLTVVSREEGSGTREAFESIVLGNLDTTLTAVVMPSNESVVDHVAHTPGAIGYVSTLWVEDNTRVLPVEGALPTIDTISDQSYPLAYSLYLATVGGPVGEAREFTQWVLGSEGQAVVRQLQE
jgi:phosphate transport system substrate-binding protein